MDYSKFSVAIYHNLFFGNLSPGQDTGLQALIAAYTDLENARVFVPGDYGTCLLAYGLGTTYHETGRAMQPVREWGQGQGQAYGKPAGPYGLIYYGRGDVQETWLSNYQHSNDQLHALGLLPPEQDMVRNPDLALDPKIAAYCLFLGLHQGWYGPPLSRYMTASYHDWIGARHCVNGTDRAELVAFYAACFYAAIQGAQP